MWEQTMAKEGVWLLSFFRFEFKWERERESGRERERQRGDVVCEHKRIEGDRPLFRVEFKGNKAGFCVCVCVWERERERERDEKKKQEGIKQRGYLVTSCKEQRLKKAKNERGAVREGIRESDTTGSCA